MKIDFFVDRSIEELININVEQLPYTFLRSYKSFVKKNYGFEIVIAIVIEKGIFVALSLHKTKFVTNAQLLSEPFTNNVPLNINEQDQFFNELMKSMSERKIADRIIAPQNFVVLGGIPTGSAFCKFGSYVLDLKQPIDVIYGNIHAKHRNKISKAERAGVIIKEGKGELHVFYKLYFETMKRSGMYCESYDFFNSMYASLSEKNCFCSVVYHNNIPQGAILAPYTKYCCYYIYGASAESISESGAINYLHWSTIKTMKEREVSRYDFVGARLSDVSKSKLEGIQSFKERFGGELKKGYLFKMDLSHLKCKVHDSLVLISNKIKGRDTFKDIIDQEIEKSRS